MPATSSSSCGQLGEAPLLATDPEHLDAVDARGGAPREQTAPLVRSVRGRLGLGEFSGAEGQGRRVVLGDVQRERLAHAYGHRVDFSELPAGAGEVPDGDQTGHVPLQRLGLNVSLAQLLCQVGGLGQHLERPVQAALRP